MYIPEFICGIIVTLVSEFLALVVYVAVYMKRRDKKDE